MDATVRFSRRPAERVRAAISPGDDPGLFLVLTVDTECSVLRQPNPDPDRVIDELIFGDFGNGGRPGGIGLHMDLLEHFGFRGCFFLDVLMEYRYGQGALEHTIEAIAARGHEIQLHVHADHLGRSSDPQVAELEWALISPDLDHFRRAIEMSVNLFERRVGRRPIAYRAGGYRIADVHFPVLEEFGIRIDSSVNPYFNSRVSDWMRTRTQPFWVGGVLEIPPTLIFLNEDSDAWGLREFAPNAQLGDPISQLPPAPGGPPRVATFVSHSFQLLKQRETRASGAISSHMKRLRSVLPGDERLLRHPPEKVRTFGPEVDDSLVTSLAGILRRIADRPDARCVTYADIAAGVDRFWPAERHPPVDPAPLLDRRSGITGVTGTRIYGHELLSHLADRDRGSLPSPGDAVDPDLIEGLERCAAAEFGERVDSAAKGLGQGESLRLRLRTLGTFPPAERGDLPQLAELLFPQAALGATIPETGAQEAVAWDAPTFVAWFRERDFEILKEHRVERDEEELTFLDRFAGKLRWIDPLELRTEALEVELRPARAERPGPFYPAPPPFERLGGEDSDEVVLATLADPVLLPAAATELYERAHPGQELRLHVTGNPAPASRTTLLLALMRAGFEILKEEDVGYRFVRPIDLADIRRFAGLA